MEKITRFNKLDYDDLYDLHRSLCLYTSLTKSDPQLMYLLMDEIRAEAKNRKEFQAYQFPL